MSVSVLPVNVLLNFLSNYANPLGLRMNPIISCLGFSNMGVSSSLTSSTTDWFRISSISVAVSGVVVGALSDMIEIRLILSVGRMFAQTPEA